MDKKHEPVKATAEQIEQWGKHERDDLDARHQRAASELEQRHRLELQKSQSKTTRLRHSEEKAAFEDRKRTDRETLEKKIEKTRELGLIPDPEPAPLQTREEIDIWPDAVYRNHRFLIAFLGFAAGTTVANIYYSQPLLQAISTYFRSNAAATSIVSVATQLGFGSGLLFFVPLGDSLERRALIVTSIIGTALMLLAAAFSSSLPLLILLSYLLGLICITPQLIVPYAAGIAKPGSQGRTVGSVMSGLLVGILFSRSVSGFIGARAGWQAVYLIAAGAMVLLAILAAIVLPPQRPERRVPYGELLASLWPILMRQSIVQRHAIIGALGFGAFSAFWTTLAFYLGNRPEHFDSQTTGLFGLVGVAGALVAPISGRMSDHFEARIVNGAALALVAVSFLLIRLADYSLIWLVVGVFLMDAGVQASHISNQTRIYAISTELRNRINSVYMVCYFFGGAVGSAIGSWAWAHFGWTGVCVAGTLFGALGLAILFSPVFHIRRDPVRP